MKKLIAILPVLLVLASCAIFKQESPIEQKVLIVTNQGKMVVKLYNETPKHRDNFIKLVDSSYYDGLLFHRVIDEFMIQGGDPDSKNALQNARLGNGGPGYTVEAEFIDGIYHKKGALAAARESDQVNPEKRSSGSQFYIVEGAVWDDDKLELMTNSRNSRVIGKYIGDYLKQPENEHIVKHIDSLRKNRLSKEYNDLYAQLTQTVMPQIEKDGADLFKLNEEQIELYKTTGGTPHLDGQYTVFGEVIFGMDVVQSISNVKTDRNNRPEEDVIIVRMRTLTEKEWKKLEKELAN